VESATPGWRLAVRDLLTGRHVVLVDSEISTRVQPGTILVSAVLTIDGVSTLLGPAPYALPSEWRVEAIEIRDAYVGPEWMAREDLEAADAEISTTYLKACYDDAPSRVLDRGTDAREPWLLRWRITTRFAETVDRLRALAEVDEGHIRLSHGPDGAPHGFFMWSRFGPSGDPDVHELLGYVYLEDGRMTADVPSRRLARTLAAEVASRLGSGAALAEARQTGHVVRVHDRFGLSFDDLTDDDPETGGLVCAWCLDIVSTRRGCRAIAIFLDDQEVVFSDLHIVVLDIHGRPVMGFRLLPDVPLRSETMGADVIFPLCSRRCEDALSDWLRGHRREDYGARVH
jgi:hypothetical protein